MDFAHFLICWSWYIDETFLFATFFIRWVWKIKARPGARGRASVNKKVLSISQEQHIKKWAKSINIWRSYGHFNCDIFLFFITKLLKMSRFPSVLGSWWRRRDSSGYNFFMVDGWIYTLSIYYNEKAWLIPTKNFFHFKYL